MFFLKFYTADKRNQHESKGHFFKIESNFKCYIKLHGCFPAVSKVEWEQ